MGITHLQSHNARQAEERRSGWREGCTVFGLMEMEFHSKYSCFWGVSYPFPFDSVLFYFCKGNRPKVVWCFMFSFCGAAIQSFPHVPLSLQVWCYSFKSESVALWHCCCNEAVLTHANWVLKDAILKPIIVALCMHLLQRCNLYLHVGTSCHKNLEICVQNVGLLFLWCCLEIIDGICVQVEHQKTKLTVGCTFLNKIYWWETSFFVIFTVLRNLINTAKGLAF